MVASYSFLTTDLVTNQVLGELPVNGVSLDCQLNSSGNMSAGMKLDDPRISNENLLERCTPGKTSFWVYREAQIVWGGIIWTREWQTVGKSLSITGQTFESYAARRFPKSWIGTSVLQYNQGQCSIIDALWQGMQSVPNGSIGVDPYAGTFDPTDVVRQLTVNGFDLSTSFDAAIQSILTFQDGPDYTISWATDNNGLPLKQLVIQPRIGSPVGSTDLIVDYPGAVKSYTYNENASSGNNQWWAAGDGTDATQLVGVATDAVSLASGWPLLEGTNSYDGVTQQSTIDAHAASDLSAFGVPLVTHSAELKADAMPTFGTYSMGDYIVINVTDPRFPDGIRFILRVIGWSIQPPDEGQGTETISLVFDEATGGSA
jgi:hypothetical protein